MLYNGEHEKQIEILLQQMTLSEKIGQLNMVGTSPVGGNEMSEEEAGHMLDASENKIRAGKIGAFVSVDNAKLANHLQKIAVEESRLGIPLLFSMDVIHGHKTIFPIPLAEACTFDDECFRRSGEIAAREASEDGINWTFAPMSDVGRDARWGRVAEGAGEDTYLTSRYTAAKVKGFQGENLSDKEHIAACVKHFAAYGAVEGGRDYGSVELSLPKFYEDYLPPYEAGIQAGAATVMTAFNDFNGVPCTMNKFLLKDLLRDKLNFEGLVISDASSIEECVNHGTAQDFQDAAKRSIEAGCDMDLGAGTYIAHLETLVNEGKVSEVLIDEAVRRILRVKFALGLFEKPYTEGKEHSSHLSAEHRQTALEIARKSIVLLKNEHHILPLDPNKKIAVIGNIAAERDEMHGTWVVSAISDTAVSLVDALQTRDISFSYAPCFDKKHEIADDMCEKEILSVNEYGRLNVKELKEAVAEYDTVVAALSYKSSGEAQSRCDLTLHGEQIKMLEILHRMGKKVIAVLFNGRPLALGQVLPLADAWVEAWHLGTEAGNAITDVLFGNYNPSGRLSTTFPYFSGQGPIYYSHTNTGRPASSDISWSNKYRDAPIEPLFPFGYGLSYSTYAYSDLQLQKEKDGVTVSVLVSNQSNYDGVETVQLYIHRQDAERVRPVRQLKGYKKVYLKAGESRHVAITVKKKELGYYGNSGEYITDKSKFDVWMAHDSSCGEHAVVEI